MTPDEASAAAAPAADRMTFLEHLDELRRRLVRAVLAVLVVFVGCFFFYQRIFNFLMQPLREVIEPLGGELIATTPPEIFVLGLKMSLLVALVISTPAWLGQLWGFVAPGLYRHERRLAVPFILVGSVFFVSGAAFCHYVLFPAAAEFLGTFGGGGEDIQIRYRVSEVFSFYARLVLGTAFVFQIPTLTLLLSRLGVITARGMVRYFKYALLGSFVLAALLTPPDPTTQIILAGPMIALYGLSIGIAWFGNRMRGRRAPAGDVEEDAAGGPESGPGDRD